MLDRLRFIANRLREKLWIRPLVACLLSLFGAFVAKGVQFTPLARYTPDVELDSVETLLVTMSGSMLVIATFAVGSMVSALASAGSSATPRTFPLVVSDDTSQNALSIFIGAFIFSLVSIVFVKNDFYNNSGLFALLVLTGITFIIVILTFVRWVDSIARLGRLGTTIDKTMLVTDKAMQRRRLAPTLRCSPVSSATGTGIAVTSSEIGYVQRIDFGSLQEFAERSSSRIVVRAVPGAFNTPDRPLAHIVSTDGDPPDMDHGAVEKAFCIGDRRTFDDDPRFGLIVLAEIAGRALSPAVNDPGTAIDILGSLVRLFAAWGEPVADDQAKDIVFDRVEVPELCTQDMFDDAFTAIARDGAGSVEVASRLQKCLLSLASIGHPAMRDAAMEHSRRARDRAQEAMYLPEDKETIRSLAFFSDRH